MALVSRRLGMRVVAVAIPIAEAAIDIDKPADLDLVESILAPPRTEPGDRDRRIAMISNPLSERNRNGMADDRGLLARPAAKSSTSASSRAWTSRRCSPAWRRGNAA